MNSRILVGIIMIAVAFVVFPIVLTGTGAILDWAGTDNASITTFTGLQPIVKIVPLLILIGMLAGGGFLTFTGFRSKNY